jgi:hypothetical protein
MGRVEKGLPQISKWDRPAGLRDWVTYQQGSLIVPLREGSLPRGVRPDWIQVTIEWNETPGARLPSEEDRHSFG